MKLKVLMIVDHIIPTTGPHRNVLGTIQALSRRDDIELSVLCERHDLKAELLLKIHLQLGFVPGNFRKIFSNLWLSFKLIRSIDVIYVPSGLKSFLYAWLLKGRKPLVAGPNVTGLPYLMNMYNPSPLMTTWMANAWIEMSELRVKECLSGGTKRSQIHLVPHSVDSNFFRPDRKNSGLWQKYNIPSTAEVILFTGRIQLGRKGIPELIEAFKIIRQKRPNAVLVFIGRAQMDVKDYESLPGVYFLGPKSGDDFADHLASADLFMAASRYETFWFCPIEAMCSGLPVVVTDAGAVPEMIPQNGIQGVRVPVLTENFKYLPEATKDLAEAALSLLRDNKKRQQMGIEARAYVSREFSEEKLADRLVNVFKSVVGLDF